MEKSPSPKSLCRSFLIPPLPPSAPPTLVHLTVVWFLRLIQQLNYFYYILRFHRFLVLLPLWLRQRRCEWKGAQGKVRFCATLHSNTQAGSRLQSSHDLYNGLISLHRIKRLSTVYHLGYSINTTKIRHLQCNQIFPEFLKNQWTFI